jgi:NAD(P)-dependent dehydrogenase (short-subunit alcohol dehydrogenase family)
VDVAPETIPAFAELSGDWNPLHTDPAHASRTRFGRPVLHGAFSAGLLSRLAGMYIPGTDCLLNSMQLRFIAPIQPPVRLRVHGELRPGSSENGHVDASITDAESGLRYVDGSYEFGRHGIFESAGTAIQPDTARDVPTESAVLVIGATGGLGQAAMTKLGSRAVGVSRRPRDGMIALGDLERLEAVLRGRRVSAVLHCGWPTPDNTRLTELSDSAAAVENYVAAPLRQCITLARVMSRFGEPNALLVLVGSTAALPGRHGYRAPLYTLGKALVPELARILAIELASSQMRSAAVVFDVVETGMNAHLAPRARLAHVDRSPIGRLPDAAEAAGQLEWLLQNRSFLVSGATITLTGGALP